MEQHVLERGPTWWMVFIVVLVGLAVAAELGFEAGRKRRGQASEVSSGQITTLLAAMLGLTSLLLAFSFSIAEDRFARRRALVLEEANAIGTTYLRAKMLPAPHDARVMRLLREYVDLRMPASQAELERGLVRSGELHDALWKEAMIAAERDPRAQPTALFITTLNELIDLHEERLTVSLHLRLPRAIFVTLGLVSLLSMGLLGFGFGLSGARMLTPTVGLAAAVAAVVVLIVELDRPAGVLFRVSRSALLDTRASMDADLRALGADEPAEPTAK